MKGLPFKKDHHTTNVAITLLPASWLFRIAAPKNFHLIKNHFVVVTGLDSGHCMKANQCSIWSGVKMNPFYVLTTLRAVLYLVP